MSDTFSITNNPLPIDEIFDTQEKTFKASFKNRFLNSCSLLTKLFFVAYHLFSGQPGRVSEAQSLLITSAAREKSFFLQDGMLSLFLFLFFFLYFCDCCFV